MSTAALIPVKDYLATTYRPDVDFLEGEIQERNVGEQSHAAVQGIIFRIFSTHRKEWAVRTWPELRVQMRAERFRVPDICVLRSSDPFEEIVTKAPMLCVEVLSSADTLRSIQARVDDYARMGVEHVWVVDPWDRVGYHASDKGMLKAADGVLEAAGTAIRVDLAEVFAELDEDRRIR